MRDASGHDARTRRTTNVRLHVVAYALLNVLVAQAAVFALLPRTQRRLDIALVCIALVFAGATPVLASALEYLAVGLHRFHSGYDRLSPYYPRTAIIVPAWNEAAVIGNTIDQLLRLAYPPDRLRVYVVDDASTDGTPEIVLERARQHPNRVVHVRREQGGQGKAHTLNAGIDVALRDDWPEAVLIIDADVLFEPDSLRKMTRHLSDPSVGAVTAYIKEGTPNANYLNRFITYEYISAQAAARRAQNVFGALACLAGGAQLHSRQNLIDIGGRIDTSTLAEDTVTTLKTQHAGNRAVFEPNAIVWAEEPRELTALWKQRMRWGRGNVEITIQFADLWTRSTGFGRLAGVPIKMLWFSVLLMPLVMLGSAVGLIGLYFVDAGTAWSVFRALWIWNLVVYAFQTSMAFAIDGAAARRSWIQALTFPGIVSLAIMVHSAYAPRATFPALLTLVMYAWCFLCIPAAYAGKLCAQSRFTSWLAPTILHIAGYGPFLCAVTFTAYMKELFNARSSWDKTVKTGVVAVPTPGAS